MDDPQVEAFFKRLREDKALGKEYRSALNGAIETAFAATIQELGARHGFRFSAAEARAHLKKQASELSNQLKGVAGRFGKSALGGSTVGFLSNPWVLAGIIAAAIAIPIVFDDDDSA